MDSANATSVPQLLKAAEVAQKLSISLRKFWMLVEDEVFPRPVCIGKRGKRWRQDELERYIVEMQAERSGE